MASELRVDTLKDSSGNNSVGMAYVSGGSAKAWMQLNGTGTIAIQGSFNTTSATDNGTGDYTQTFSSAIANNDFSVVSDGSALNDTYNQGTAASSPTTTTCRVNCWNTATNSQADFNQVYTSVFGDLA